VFTPATATFHLRNTATPGGAADVLKCDVTDFFPAGHYHRPDVLRLQSS